MPEVLTEFEGKPMSATPKIVTITNPTELLLAQLSEIRDGNTATRKEIERLTKLLRGGQNEEARLERKLDSLLTKSSQQQIKK